MDSISRAAGLEKTVSEYIRSNVYITSSGMFNPALLRQSLGATSIDRLLFSTDYPFHRPTQLEIAEFLTEFDTDDDRDKFTSGNARRLFGIDG